MGDFARLGVAAAVGNVGLQDIDRLVLDKLAQPPAVTLHLAGGQGDPGRAAQIGEGTGVVLLQRLLEPGEIARSEEHTSELQSLMRISYAVFCLKKKKKTTTDNKHLLTHKTATKTTRVT